METMQEGAETAEKVGPVGLAARAWPQNSLNILELPKPCRVVTKGRQSGVENPDCTDYLGVPESWFPPSPPGGGEGQDVECL